MDLQQSFLLAAVPEPVTLLGQQLEPYSVGHEILLRRHDSPFVTPRRLTPENATAALFLGVFICCQSYEQACRATRARDLPETVRKWKKKLDGGARASRPLSSFLRPRPAKAGETPAVLAHRLTLFQNYVTAGQTVPLFRTLRRAPPRPRGAPFLACLLNTLTTRLGHSVSDALNCPLALAHWLYLSHWETEGSILIRDRSEEEELAREIEEAAAKLGLQRIKCN